MRKNAIYLTVAVTGMVMGRALAGSLNPTNAPGPTMHTLEEIYQKVQNLVPQDVQNFSATTAVVKAGCYAETNLTQVDADLTAANIRWNVTIFGITGTMITNVGGTYSAAVPKTGQKDSWDTGDDGYYQKGVAWPNPRFTVQADTNCVLDNMTGLMWARNANLVGATNWSKAIIYCEDLNYGGQTDWRLPNRRELFSLIDDGNGGLPVGSPFTGVQSGYYWSSTADHLERFLQMGRKWIVAMGGNDVGSVILHNTTNYNYYVWPVRGGQ